MNDIILPPRDSIEKKERRIESDYWIGKYMDCADSVSADSTVEIEVRGVAEIRGSAGNSCTRACNPGRSMATAALHDHVFVLLQYNVAFVEEIQH